LEFGAAMPAFRVVVNSASVHGSIGYSTNLFPAMTLGCGAPGGNITSDNIGPLHLINVKRIAWESRAVEHRTVPADQRMAGASIPGEAVAVQEKAEVAALASAPSGPASLPRVPEPLPVPKTQELKSAAPATAASTVSMDRAAIARVVTSVLAAKGIARGSGMPKTMPAPELSTTPKESPTPSLIAAEIASRFFGPNAKTNKNVSENSSTTPSGAPPIPARVAEKRLEPPKAVAEIQVFVSENDVRRAMTRSEKIFIGRKTILTPSARDLGIEHEVFVETEAGSLR
jgi:hypothetical protein